MDLCWEFSIFAEITIGYICNTLLRFILIFKVCTSGTAYIPCYTTFLSDGKNSN